MLVLLVRPAAQFVASGAHKLIGSCHRLLPSLHSEHAAVQNSDTPGRLLFPLVSRHLSPTPIELEANPDQ
jgi:hypothetical protein